MPDWKRYLRETLVLPAMKDHREERMIEEIADHLEDLYREAVSRGATPDEAERTVKAWLGDPERVAEALAGTEPHRVRARMDRWFEGREDALRSRGGLRSFLADGLRDLRLGARSLARRPAFTGVSVLVLAFGIGATTAIFTLLDAVVLSPLPFDAPERLVTIHHAAEAWGMDDAGQCAAWHFTYEDESQAFEALGMFSGGRSLVTGEGPPEALAALQITEGVLEALRLAPVVGRGFGAADMDPDGPGTVMLGEGYWRTRYGRDPAVVGRTLRVNGEPREIIGVVPRRVSALGVAAPDLVTPLRFRRASLFVGNIGYGGVGRLREGVDLEAATQDLNRVLPLAWEKFAGGPVESSSGDPSGFTARLRPLEETVVGPVADLLWVVLGGVGVVLLIACANVATLVLVRAEGRQGEMSVRAAMGASGPRMAWESLKESLVLGVLGGAGGLLFAWLGLGALLRMAPPDLPRLGEVALDGRVLLFALALSLGTALLFGLAPVVHYGRARLVQTLKAGGHGGVRAGGRRARDLSAVLQMALALVLLVASGLLLRSFQALRSVDPGFGDPDDVAVARLYIPRPEVEDPADVASTYETIARRVEAIPGVTAVAYGTSLPMDGNGNVNPFYVRGREEAPEARRSRRHKWVGGGYFETLHIPLLAGRAITWEDAHERAPVAVLSETLAREAFGSPEAALGRHVAARPDPPVWKEVVGVARDVREDGPAQAPPDLVYWPQVTLAFWEGNAPDEVETWRDAGLAIRGPRIRTEGFRQALESAIWEVNPNLPLLRLQTMPELMAGYTERTSFTLILMGIAGGMALVLGLVGVYGVIAYGVSRRSHELGMRMALGANRSRVLRMVLRQGAGLAAVGIFLGLALAWSLSRFIAALLFEVAPVDPLTYGLIAGGLLLVALGASYLPARRAAGVDPVEALRME
jgi:predicted permease